MGGGVEPDRTHPAQDVLTLDIDRELRAYRAKQLAADGGASELAHVVLAGMAAILAWATVPHTQVLLGVVAVAVASLGRAVYRRSANREDADPARILSAIRRGVAAVGLAWGAGVIVMGPSLPIDSLAWITVIFAGLIAGGTVTLLADPAAFYILLITLLVPLGVAVGMNGETTSHLVGVAVVAMYGVAMAAFYRRANAMLLDQFRTAKRLELTERAAREAREAAQRLSRIIEATTDHVGVAGPDGRLRYLNRAGREMIGIGSAEDVTQLNVLELTPARLRDHVQNVEIPIAVRDGSLATESIFAHRDGREIPVSLVVLVQRAPDGTVETMSAIARDITEQVAAREALKTARDAAEQATNAKSAFLANTSHEIRTPLNGILGMVELLLDSELTPDQRRSVELIASSGETLLETLNDVLDLSKIEAAQLELEEIPFDLHQLLYSSALYIVSWIRTAAPCTNCTKLLRHSAGESYRATALSSLSET